jgi:hydroxymethylpyrimidine/phosphomethylpyrimidine kinase
VIRTALSIAGSDPSGGAGIQADLKTFLDHQLYGMAVITGLTAQNTRGVVALEPVRPAFIAEQIAAVLDDMRVDAIKVGMVPSQAAAHAIVRALEGYRGPVVVDPLLFASDDTPIGPGQAGLAALVDRATLVTPNGPECTRLIGDRSPGEWAAETSVAVLRTGGHDVGAMVHDRLFLPDGTQHAWAHPRVQSRNTHGTGCTLSASITAGLSRQSPMVEAVADALTYMHALLTRSQAHRLGSGCGPLLHGAIQSIEAL